MKVGQVVLIKDSSEFNGFRGKIKEVLNESHEIIVTLDGPSYNKYTLLIKDALAKQGLNFDFVPSRHIYIGQDEIEIQ